MRLPVYASVRLDTSMKRPRCGYNPPVPLRCYPGEFYNQGCTWLEIGPLRMAVVWSNPPKEAPRHD